MKNSSDFTKVWAFLKQIDYYAGTFVFGKPEKFTWKEKVLSLTLPLVGLNMLILVISTMIVSKFSLLSIIIGISFCTTATVICYVVWTFMENKSDVNAFLDWCRGLYDLPAKFHPALRDLAATHLETVLSSGNSTENHEARQDFVVWRCVSSNCWICSCWKVSTRKHLSKVQPPCTLHLPVQQSENMARIFCRFSWSNDACFTLCSVDFDLTCSSFMHYNAYFSIFGYREGDH